MKACHLQTALEPPTRFPTIAMRWANAFAADAVAIGDLRALVGGGALGSLWPYQLVFADATLAGSVDVFACRELLDRAGAGKLLLHIDRSLPRSEDLAPYRALLSAADLVLTADYEIGLDVADRLGIRACTIAAPYPVAGELLPRAPRRRRTLLVVARAGYGRRDLIREIGLLTYLATRVRHRIRVLGPESEQLPEQIRQSELVYLPEPIEDGGELAARCAEAGALLIANQRYDAAKVTFPYTTFDVADPRRRMALLFWMYTSPEFADFFRDNARRSTLHLSAENRRAELVRKLQYRFPEANYEPRAVAGGSLLDQIRHRSGPRQFSYAEDECVAVCLVRNGQEHLPSFLRHHRALGIRHFIFVDNGSDDQTLPLLDQQADVTVYETSLPHKHYENEMRRLVIEEHCRHRFCLNVDIDELFDYPASDRLSLRDLLGYLRRRGATAMAAYMLDMYAKENRFSATETLDLIQAYPYYDISNIKKLDYFTSHVQAYCDRNVLLADHVKCYFGGIRKTVFKSKTGGHYLLTKHPLIYLDGTLEPVTNPHYCNNATVADVTGVIRHYKFTPSFKEKVSESRAAKRYVKFAQNQYEEYHRKIGERSSIRIDTPGTRLLHNVNQLLDEGFIATSPAFEEYVLQVAREARSNGLGLPQEAGPLERDRPGQTASA
jgi:hypothetical protein